MKKFLLILVGVILPFMIIHPTSYASENGEYGRYYQCEDEEEIPIDVIIAANLAGIKYNICPELLEAIAYHESRYIADINNGSGCYGLMQINLSSHKSRLQKLNIEVEDIYDPYNNMLVAADILSELFTTYEDPAIVLALYHGEKKFSVNNPSKYVREILEHSELLEKQHGLNVRDMYGRNVNS